MCRLYGFISNAPRKVECELVASQNALLAQSMKDERGMSNPDGWGLGSYRDNHPSVTRQPRAAYEGEEFRWAAAEVHSADVMAHVRRATIGSTHIDNTHPFRHGDWLLSHNGNMGAFDSIRRQMLDAMEPEYRDAIRGTTDSEAVFHLLLSIRDRNPDVSLAQLLRETINLLRKWSEEADPMAEVALNLLLTDGQRLAGSRFGRSLWYLRRKAVHRCEICGELHIKEDPGDRYRAVVVASEPITSDEEWREFPEASLFHVDQRYDVQIEYL